MDIKELGHLVLEMRNLERSRTLCRDTLLSALWSAGHQARFDSRRSFNEVRSPVAYGGQGG